jgi:2-polyprenyl-6-methoxyphenol hydroxylase-like FAD-dependent oxidoreductase
MREKLVIVGGGISGIATALALKKVGLTVSIYEKKSQNSLVGSGIILSGNVIATLDYLDVLAPVLSQGITSDRFLILDHHGKPITTIQSKQKYPLFIFIHRNELIDILFEALTDKHIYYDKRLVFFTTDHKKSQLYFEDGTIVKTDYLLGCDGVHSMVRTQLFPNKQLRYAGYTCWKGIVEQPPEFYTTVPSETWGPKGRFGIIPLSKNRFYWYALKNAEPNNLQHKTWKTKDIVSNFADYHDPIPQLIGSTSEELITHRDIYDLESLYQYVYDRILLLGDAAHAATPNFGQGDSLAVEDAVFLAKCYQQVKNLERAMQRFEKGRLSQAKRVIQESWMYGKIAQIDTPFICTIRNQMMKWTPASFHQSRLDALQNWES